MQLRSLISAVALAAALAHPSLAQDLPPATEATPPAFGLQPQPADEPEAPADIEAPDEEEDAPPEPSEDEATQPPTDEAPDEAPDAMPPAAVTTPDLDALADEQIVEVVRETFDDWQVRCLPEGDDCFLYQLALDEEGNPVAEFSLVRLPAGGEAVAGVTVVTPLGTLLPAGLYMQVDGGELRQYPFTFCSQVGCFAQLALTQTTVSALQRGRVAKLIVAAVTAPDDPVELDVSLIGFTAAFNSIEPGQ